MLSPSPVGLPGLAVLAFGTFVFFAMLLVARARREPEMSNPRSRRSVLGIAVQGFGIAIVAGGTQRIVLDPLGGAALAQAAVVALLLVATIGLFAASTRAMGPNWSLVARTRADHVLVTAGPFAHVRHPIYLALFLFMLAIAIATGHESRLLLGTPIYAIGTWLRVIEEERLLRAMFGAAYDAYAARVTRFVPGVF